MDSTSKGCQVHFQRHLWRIWYKVYIYKLNFTSTQVLFPANLSDWEIKLIFPCCPCKCFCVKPHWCQNISLTNFLSLLCTLHKSIWFLIKTLRVQVPLWLFLDLSWVCPDWDRLRQVTPGGCACVCVWESKSILSYCTEVCPTTAEIGEAFETAGVPLHLDDTLTSPLTTVVN